jgi:hypothetical protein
MLTTDIANTSSSDEEECSLDLPPSAKRRKQDALSVIMANAIRLGRRHSSSSPEQRDDERIAALKTMLLSADSGDDLAELKKQILLENTLKCAHSFCLSNRLLPQRFGPLIEYFVLARSGCLYSKNCASERNGDFKSRISNLHYELKASLGGKTFKKFNFVQIRFGHQIDFYILTAFLLSASNVSSGGELFIFKVPKLEMAKLVQQFGSLAHGTTAECDDCKTILTSGREYCIRPSVNGACWTELCRFRISEVALGIVPLIAGGGEEEKKEGKRERGGDASLVREIGLDQFYTRPEVAKRCIDQAGLILGDDWSKWDCIVEPSAGAGAFVSHLPPSLKKLFAVDVSPPAGADSRIAKLDFFDFSMNRSSSDAILVIGNPPFGKNASLAVKFFNHAATFATAIAFIVPRTFRKVSVQNRLSLDFRLSHDEEIETMPCAFTPEMSAKCCFQIWTRCVSARRALVCLPTSHRDWTFLSLGPNDSRNQPTPPVGADFALRAYGGKCGDILAGDANLASLRPKSWHFIKAAPHMASAAELIRRFQALDFSSAQDTARQNSLGRGELVSLYNTCFAN